MIQYLIQSTVCLAAFYLLYLLFLKKERAFKFIRFYLLGAIVFSLVIPLVEVPLLSSDPMGLAQYDFTFTEISVDIEDPSVATGSEQAESTGLFSASLVLLTIYFAGALLMTVRFFRNLYKISALKRSGRYIAKQGYRLIILDSPIYPFSFFRHIFISESDYSGDSEELILHEKAHAVERHTLDILFTEFLMVIFWFQPLLFFYRKAIALNHEFLADDFVLRHSQNSHTYLHKILEVSNHRPQVHLASNFSFYSLKNRIKMMSKKRLTKKRLALKSGLVAVVAIGLLTAFAFTTKHITNTPAKEFVVILDAGHGGGDPGATSPSGLLEKDISLSIVKKVKANFGETSSFKIKTTREKDENLELSKRIELTKEADLFISVHVESHEDPNQDFTFITYSELNAFKEKSNQVANLLAYEFYQCGKDSKVAYTYDYYILKNAQCPAVMISAGFLSNKFGEEFLSSESGQIQIAEQISDAIRMAAL